jgi:hypothetical protein
MSSILDALEKASKERAAKRGDLSAASLGRESAREKQLVAEAEHHRQRAKMIALSAVLLVLCGVGGVFAFLQLRDPGASGAVPSSSVHETDSVPPTVTTPPTTEPPAASQPPAAEPPSAAAAAVAPAPTPWPTPTPWPSPTQPPTPEPTQAVYIENAAPVSTASYKGIFKDGQIIRPAEIGMEVGGVMELKSGNVALVNGKQVRAGQKIGELHVIDVQAGLLTVDVGDGTVVKVRF